jgi:hypothetical protein
MYQIGLPLVDVEHHLFNYTKKEGWTIRDMEVCKEFILTLANNFGKHF